jgi:hypothetical protein
MQTQSHWVRLGYIGPREIISFFIASSRSVSIAVVRTPLAKVSVVIAFEFKVKNFGLDGLYLALGWKDLLVNDFNDSIAVFL